MGRKKESLSTLESRGSLKARPGRYQDRVDIPRGDGVGVPPLHLNEAAQSAWLELENMDEHLILSGHDRPLFELAVCLYAEHRENPQEFPANKMAQLRALMNDLGLSATARRSMRSTAGSDDLGELAKFVD